MLGDKHAFPIGGRGLRLECFDQFRGFCIAFSPRLSAKSPLWPIAVGSKKFNALRVLLGSEHHDAKSNIYGRSGKIGVYLSDSSMILPYRHTTITRVVVCWGVALDCASCLS